MWGISLPGDELTVAERRCQPTWRLTNRGERHDQIQIRPRDKHHGRCPCMFLTDCLTRQDE